MTDHQEQKMGHSPKTYDFLYKMGMDQICRAVQGDLTTGTDSEKQGAINWLQTVENKALWMACCADWLTAEALGLTWAEWLIAEILRENGAVPTHNGFIVERPLNLRRFPGPVEIPVFEATSINAAWATHLSFPILGKVQMGGGIELTGSTRVSFPALQLVQGPVRAQGAVNVSLGLLESIEGPFHLQESNWVSAPNLVWVKGDVLAMGSNHAQFPLLETVEGTLNLRKSDGFRAPNLTKVGIYYRGQRPDLETPALRGR